jgi:Fe-Mn family superoxide dismutase
MTAVNRAIETEPGAEPLPSKHSVPPLPYDHGALEQVIDTKTMVLHHDYHHAAYVQKLNSALNDYPELQRRSALWLLLNPEKVPMKIRTVIRHNAGGHVNHSLLWKAMSPAGHGAPSPAGALAAAIDRDFGSLDEFKERFVEAGEKLFGSGWVWLAESRGNGGKLKICTTNGHGNPLLNGCFPILLNDVWEHAYYLNYQNRRRDYLRAWWSVVNWEEAARRFNRSSDHAEERNWEDEGGAILSSTKSAAK